MEERKENGGIVDAMLENMQQDERYQMEKAKVLSEYDKAQAQASTPETQKLGARVLRAVARPFLHIFAELLGAGVLGVCMMVAVAAVLLGAMFLTMWAAQVAGIPADSPQNTVLAIAAGVGALYVFVTETRRLSRKLREWTDTIHRQIEGA